MALTAAFLGHFILDAIPHWHYRILSVAKDESSFFGEKMTFGINFLKDILRTGIDLGLGMLISLTISRLFYPDYLWLTFFCALAGALPDLLQVVYYRFPKSLFFYFEWLHEKIHSKKRLDDKPVKGMLQQITISAVIILATVFLL